MGRKKGSKNKISAADTLIPALTQEQRIQFLADLILEAILTKQQEELTVAKEFEEEYAV